MSRQLRRVPANWKHPQRWSEPQDKIVFRPMTQGYYGRVKEWRKELTTWRYHRELWENVGVVETYLDLGLEDNPHNFEQGLLTVDCMMQRCIMQYERERKKYGYDKMYHGLDQYKMEHGIFTFEDEYGGPPAPPNPSDYMPYGLWYQLFEEVSEGTPITPAFATKKELIEYLATTPDYWGNQWTRAQAVAMVAEEWAPSMVMANGRLMNSAEAVEDGYKNKTEGKNDGNTS